MCGIAGAFDATTQVPLPLTYVQAAAAAMRRRGPDAEGFAQAPGLAVAHRRLGVIDPQGSPQPWVDEATGDVLVFNGEIYNYRALRAALTDEGAHFRSAGDTEALLRALQHWGRAALQRLNGMFAFAWYRARDRRLWLVRDHAGIKPLFYAHVGERCYFASTMAAMLTFPDVARHLDLATFSHYLSTVRSTLGSRTLVAGVQTLEPGHFLELSPRQPVGTPQRWWSLPVVPAHAKREREMAEVAEEVRHLVRSAVDRQLVSDVPLGGFLSGGLDSTIIAGLAHELSAGHYDCYAVGYAREGANGKAYHEFPYIELASRELGVPCERIELDEGDYLDDWTFLVHEKGQPLSTPNEVGIFRLAEALRERHTVALSGEGADEVFAGYAVPYASAWDFERAALAHTWPEEPRQRFQASLTRLYGTTEFTHQADHYLRLNSWIPLGLKYKLLSVDAIVGAQHDEPMLHYYRHRLDTLSELSPMDRYLHLLAQTNLEGLLSRLDSSTMAASVESRVPFTDPDLIRCAFNLRDADKLDFVDDRARTHGQALNAAELDQGGYLCAKRALREAFADTVPEEILTRAKMSFPVPFQECFAGPWHDFATRTLRESPLINALCDRGAVSFLLENCEHNGLSIALWPLVNMAVWADTFDISLPAHGGGGEASLSASAS
ncbi:MAG: asparagine synthase (glutamine-hydrolyzing) [Pseudomonadota bacterium]